MTIPLYITYNNSLATRPIKELKISKEVSFMAIQQATIEFKNSINSFTYNIER